MPRILLIAVLLPLVWAQDDGGNGTVNDASAAARITNCLAERIVLNTNASDSNVLMCPPQVALILLQLIAPPVTTMDPDCDTSDNPVVREACRPGFVLSLLGQAVICPAGFFCPTGLKCATACLPGAYCPSPGVFDTATNSCSTGTFYPNVTVCGGQALSSFCPAGSFCATPKEIEICPENNHCIEGSSEPHPCPGLTLCPEGTSIPTKNFVLLGVVIALIIFVVLLLLFLPKNWVTRAQVLFGSEKRAEIKRKLLDNKFQPYDSTMETGNKEPREGAEQAFNVNLDFDNLTYVIENAGITKTVLSGVTASIRAGRVTAIMGPSGSGKSSLLKALCNKVEPGSRLTGDMYINNEKVPNLDKYNRIVGYVPQDDIMIRPLTVKETLRFYARLRLSSSITKAERKQVVNETIDVLNIPATTLDTPIGDENTGGISGGQRKRVNIGMEMVACPRIIFLDEPTSGLDSLTSLEIFKSLHLLAEQRKVAVVAVIHQPRYEIFCYFDDMILLATGGRLAYAGPRNLAVPQFERVLGRKCPERVNKADFLLDVISGHPSEEPPDEDAPPPTPGVAEAASLRQRRVTTDSAHPLTKQTASEVIDSVVRGWLGMERPRIEQGGLFKPEILGFWSQLRYFHGRATVQEMRGARVFLMDIFFAFSCGGLMSLFFFGKANLTQFAAIGFMTSIAVNLTSALAAIRVFGSERTVYYRESGMGFNTFPYFMAKNLSQVTRLVLCPLAFFLLYYTLISFPSSPTTIYGILFLMQWAGESFGFMVSAWVAQGNMQTAVAFGIIVFAVTGGVNPKLGEMNSAAFVTYFSPSRWGIQALFKANAEQLPKVYSSQVCASYETFSYWDPSFSDCMLALFLLGLAFRILAYVGLIFTAYTRHHTVMQGLRACLPCLSRD